MIELSFQSKSAANLMQIVFFMAINLCSFQFIGKNLRKYVGVLKTVPDNMHRGMVLRIISIFHATFVTLMCMFILYYDQELSQNKLLYSSFAISFTLNFSIGFLLFDMLIMITDPKEFEWFYLLHHFVSIIAFYSCSTAGVFPYIALFRLTSEASTPFLNIRWFLLTLNKKHTNFYLLNGIILIVVFFLVRIVTILPNWLIFYSLMHTPTWNAIGLHYKLICVFSCIPLDFLNIYWFGKIVNIIVKFFKAASTIPGAKREELLDKVDTKAH